MVKRETYKYEIGIDPGVNTGFAVWNQETKEIEEYGEFDFWEVYFKVQDYPVEETRVEIEMPKLIKRMFWDKYAAKGVVPWKEFRKALRISKNVGECGREAELMAEGLREIGYAIDERKPHGKKWNQAATESITGIHTNVSESNVRDAIRFVFRKPLGTRQV